MYAYNLSAPTNDNQVVAKIDHSISNANKLSVRYFWDDYFNVTNYAVPSFNGTLDWVTQNVALNDTHIFTPSLVNTATLTVARNNFFRSPEVTSPANWKALGCQTTCVPLAPPNIATDWILGINGGLGLGIATNYMSHMMNYHYVDPCPGPRVTTYSVRRRYRQSAEERPREL